MSTFTPRSAPIRFTVAGLRAAADSYLAGTLPPHRFVWELRCRIDTLAGLGAPPRAVTRLRWLLRAVDQLGIEDPHALAESATELRATLAATLAPSEPGTLDRLHPGGLQAGGLEPPAEPGGRLPDQGRVVLRAELPGRAADRDTGHRPA